MTTFAAPPATAGDADCGLLAVDSSGFDPLLRAESAANGETLVGRASDGDSDLLISGTTDGLPEGRDTLTFASVLASLSNCSIGSKRCACPIFNKPNSK